ncbi:uncharacterized protein BJX67DRAFT_363749 [Aspergillus lucknowensis]|uniref:Secreted protein n=1 Tax=Aspergillus lucknowensis TaxID=176173 RepID=A0ABR4LG34_9EURO
MVNISRHLHFRRFSLSATGVLACLRPVSGHAGLWSRRYCNILALQAPRDMALTIRRERYGNFRFEDYPY